MNAKRAMLFPGQGAQFVGMGRDFYESSEPARKVFQQADRALGIELSEICFDGPASRLEETDVCQPAILTTSVAIVTALEAAGKLRRDEFAATAGLSLGEYTALWFAGVLEFVDAVRLVRTRGQAMQHASDLAPSGMISLLGADEASVVSLCEECGRGDVLVPANFLAPGNIAVSGTKAATGRVAAAAKAAGIRRAIPLKVAGAFHSELMRPAREILQKELEDTRFHRARMPVISNVTANPYESENEVPANLLGQVTSPVLWERSMRRLLEMGINEFVEPGPGTVLSGLMAKIQRDTRRHTVNSVKDSETLGVEES